MLLRRFLPDFPNWWNLENVRFLMRKRRFLTLSRFANNFQTCLLACFVRPLGFSIFQLVDVEDSHSPWTYFALKTFTADQTGSFLSQNLIFLCQLLRLQFLSEFHKPFLVHELLHKFIEDLNTTKNHKVSHSSFISMKKREKKIVQSTFFWRMHYFADLIFVKANEKQKCSLDSIMPNLFHKKSV